MAAKQQVQATERMYQILKKPMVTEKSTMVAEGNWVAFEVEGNATKPEIKQAVETLFKVTVERVNTLNRKGKTKRFRMIKGQQSDRKLAYIRLKDGQSVDVAAGV